VIHKRIGSRMDIDFAIHKTSTFAGFGGYQIVA